MAAKQTEAYLGLGGQLIEFLIDPKSGFQKDLQNDVYTLLPAKSIFPFGRKCEYTHLEMSAAF